MFPLEFAYHLLGDVTGLRIVDFGCGSGANEPGIVGQAPRSADQRGPRGELARILYEKTRDQVDYIFSDSLATITAHAADIGDVIMGCVLQAGAGMNVARQAALRAGVPVEVPGALFSVRATFYLGGEEDDAISERRLAFVE